MFHEYVQISFKNVQIEKINEIPEYFGDFPSSRRYPVS